MVTLRNPDRVRRLVPSLVIAGVALFAFSPVVAWMPPLAFNRPAAYDRIAPVFPRFLDQDLTHLDRIDQRRVTFDLVDMPVESVLKTLGKECNVPFWIDELSLTDAGVELAAPVTLRARDQLVRDVLVQLLEPLGLGWTLEDGVLKIYSIGSGCEKSLTGIYPVADLVDDGEASWKELESAIRDNSSGMWDDVDGEGGRMGRVTGARSLVVHQTYKAHAEIDRFLTALRAAKRIGQTAGRVEQNATDD